MASVAETLKLIVGMNNALGKFDAHKLPSLNEL